MELTGRTNEAAVLHAPGDVRVEGVGMPSPGPGEVLVEVAAVGVCGSDVHYFQHGRIGEHVVRAPMVLGHEAAGTIVGVGDGVDAGRVGERVALEPGVPDLSCEQCLAGRYNLCPAVRFFATPPVDGAFARFVTIHAAFAHPLPDDLGFEAGALLEPLSVAIWAHRRAGTGPGDRVLVTGAGPIGNLCAQVAVARGAAEVVVSDVVPERLDAARAAGATRTVRADRGEATAVACDVLVECSGNPTALRQGIEAVRPGGRAVIVGMGPDATAEVPIAHIQNREIWLTGTFRFANTYPAAMALARSGRVDLEGIITDRFALGETERALRATERPAAIKAMVLPGG
jgi:L-iditol 2-dehydrogenase